MGLIHLGRSSAGTRAFAGRKVAGTFGSVLELDNRTLSVLQVDDVEGSSVAAGDEAEVLEHCSSQNSHLAGREGVCRSEIQGAAAAAARESSGDAAAVGFAVAAAGKGCW